MAEVGLREAKRRETHRALGEAAFELAVLHGVDGFTIDDVVDSIHYSRRTFFNHFAAKEEAIVSVATERMKDAVAQVFAHSRDVPLSRVFTELLRARFTDDAIAGLVELRRLAIGHPALTSYLAAVEQQGITEAARTLTEQSRGALTSIQAHMVVGAAYGAIAALMEEMFVEDTSVEASDAFALFDFDSFAGTVADFLEGGVGSFGA